MGSIPRKHLFFEHARRIQSGAERIGRRIPPTNITFQSGISIARSCEVNRAVVVAVIAVRMVQVAVDEIVDVISMRHRFMAAPTSVNVARVVAAAARRALVRIFGAHFELMLVYMIAVRMMQMTVMQIINVIVVLDRSMSTVRAMLMVVVSVMWFVAGAHVDAPW